MSQIPSDQIEQMLLLVSKNNKYAKRRNRLVKKQQKQTQLNYQQTERFYLIEKSKMQPSFRLKVTEFLLNLPDYVNDPEQATEAKYLVDKGFEVDQRILRIKLDVKHEASFMQPNITLPRRDLVQAKELAQEDERATSLDSTLFFSPVESLKFNSAKQNEAVHRLPIYLVYRDQTTLPVVLKYELTQQHDARLLRWEVEHVDTVFATSRKQLSQLNTADGCEAFVRQSAI